jgi:chemotaxis protein methyltransferase CheR
LERSLIYFDNPTKSALLKRAREAIAPDGALVLGGAETTMGLDESWDRVPVGTAAYYVKGRPPGG